MKEKDALATLSRNQSDPGEAKPEDFAILTDSDANFTGQNSDKIQRESDIECGRGKFGGTPDRPNVNRADKPHGDGMGEK